ncbi:MAG: LppP/LprE family lipoprotein [Pseudonocardiaceae bacterium]
MTVRLSWLRLLTGLAVTAGLVVIVALMIGLVLAPDQNQESTLDQGNEPVAPFDVSSAHLLIKSFGYDPNSAPIPPGPLRAITAVCTISATEHCQQIFFFHAQDFVGVGSGESDLKATLYRGVKILNQDGQTVRMDYAVYKAMDANCCPSARQAQNYRYRDGILEYQNDSGPWQPAPSTPKVHQ